MRKFEIKFPERKPFDVVGFGLNSIDHLCVLPHHPEFNSKVRIQRYAQLGGGQVATAMTTCARLGLKTKYIGKVGSDDLGKLSIQSLREAGIDVSSITVEPEAKTQFAFILIDERNGDRTILWQRDEKLMYRNEELKREDVCRGRILHLDGHDIKASIQAIEWAKREGIPVSIDVDKVESGTEALIKEVDFLICTTNFLYRLTGLTDRELALRRLKDYTSGFLCATLGAEGAIALINDEVLYSPGFAVKAIDTTGAGDVFHGAFIYGLLQDWDVERILRFANAAAALNCTAVGARGGIPTLNQVMDLTDTTTKRQADVLEETRGR
jgi:sugar/nucleoside kinase (ribokinase family)